MWRPTPGACPSLQNVHVDKTRSAAKYTQTKKGDNIDRSKILLNGWILYCKNGGGDRNRTDE